MNKTEKYPKLDFPAITLEARRRGEQVEVWDCVRRIYVVLTPEEWVRQHLVHYLIAQCGVAPRRIVEEYPVDLNGQPQRADVVVVDDAARPLLLAECKAAEVALTQKTLQQAVRYNSVLGARYIVLTNGQTHSCFERSATGAYRPLASFPKW